MTESETRKLFQGKANQTRFNRVFWIVMDGVGCGAAPDASAYHDDQADTLGNLSRSFLQKTGKQLELPNLMGLGLSQISQGSFSPATTSTLSHSWRGKAKEQSAGKDTTSGHWEMAGHIVKKAFQVYPDGFPVHSLNEWVQKSKIPGFLGNKPASGTEIIEELGLESVRSGKPILYTSADSVWQVAAHEQYFGLNNLYRICEIAREICDDLGVARVIARPFIGEGTRLQPYKRTYNRKDYARPPEAPTLLTLLQDQHIPTKGVGKIASIFGHSGIDLNIDTKGNRDGMQVLLQEASKTSRGLIYANLIDFDMLYGHRRDVLGFGQELEVFDQELGKFLPKLKHDDVVILTADHGNDPTFRGTDHTREYVPVLAWSPSFTSGGRDLGLLESFGDMGASISEMLLGFRPKELTSFHSFLSAEGPSP